MAYQWNIPSLTSPMEITSPGSSMARSRRKVARLPQALCVRERQYANESSEAPRVNSTHNSRNADFTGSYIIPLRPTLTTRTRPMSWNKNFVFIRAAAEPEYDHFFAGCSYQKSGTTDFRSISSKNWTRVSVGYVDGNVWITIPREAHKLHQVTVSDFEQWLTAKYPTHEILSLLEDGTAGCYGFACLRDGKRVRILSGCEAETYVELGKHLPLEA